MIRNKLALALLCILLTSCNNAFMTYFDMNYSKTKQSRYIVIFDNNGGEKEAAPNRKIIISPETTVKTLPADPVRNGYNFTGWNTIKNGTGNKFTEVTVVKEHCTVYAQWQRK